MGPIKHTRVVDAALDAPANLQPKTTITKTQIGKANKAMVTIQCPVVSACGHKFDPSRQPRHRNCQSCWFTWLNEHGELVQTAEECYVNEGPEVLTQLQGKVFTHNLLKFLSTVANLKANAKGKNE